jgi:hypothetical protein
MSATDAATSKPTHFNVTSLVVVAVALGDIWVVFMVSMPPS